MNTFTKLINGAGNFVAESYFITFEIARGESAIKQVNI
jgi:hypothetical protein